ncbi:Ger(x)C family spore germination protein [Peribacillus asahii]|uniref:Ger(X)C family spore germination protein n=1 Tax=Peribacillus asahii TaxID=228899 RepID=A0A398BBR3_9BACI|nr:Ger(x)C family spore germination protein [Peribacillus asahii]
MLHILCIFGLILLLSGCWDRVEVNDLAIVTAAAIDIKDDNQIELSLQVFIPKALSTGGGQGGSGQGGGGAATLVRSQRGSNISDALSKLQSKIPRKVFWGQCKVFIFGEKLAKQGIQEHMDFLLRHPQPRERAYLYVSKGNPKDALEVLPPLERYSGEVLRELSDLHIGMQVTMQDVQEGLVGVAQAGAFPFIKILPPGKGEEKLQGIPYIVGTAVFKKDKMVGTMSEKATRGILWLRNEMEAYTVILKPEGVKGEVSLNPVSARIKLIPQIRNDKWKMLVNVDTEGAVVQNGTNLALTSPKSIQTVEKAYQEDIKDRIELAIQQAQHKMKADIIKFSKEFYRKYPKEWKKVENRWDEVFPKVEVEVNVEAHIRRQGYINKPGGLPEKEVKKQ